MRKKKLLKDYVGTEKMLYILYNNNIYNNLINTIYNIINNIYLLYVTNYLSLFPYNSEKPC